MFQPERKTTRRASGRGWTAALAAMALLAALAAGGCPGLGYERLPFEYVGPYAPLYADLRTFDDQETVWSRGRVKFPFSLDGKDAGEAVLVTFQRGMRDPIDRMAILLCRRTPDGQGRELVARKVVYVAEDWKTTPFVDGTFLPRPERSGHLIHLQLLEEDYEGHPLLAVAVMGGMNRHRAPVWFAVYRFTDGELVPALTGMSYQRSSGLQLHDYDRDGRYELRLSHVVLSDETLDALGEGEIEPEWPSVFVRAGDPKAGLNRPFVLSREAHPESYRLPLEAWNHAFVNATARGASAPVLAEFAYHLGRMRRWNGEDEVARLLFARSFADTDNEALRDAARAALADTQPPPPQRVP